MKKLFSFSAFCSILILISCSSVTDGPSDSEAKEAIEEALMRENPRCPSVDKTLTVDIISRLEPKEVESIGNTYYDIRAKVNFDCYPNSEDATEYTDTFRFDKATGEWRAWGRNTF